MNDDELNLLIDLHIRQERQGPGSEETSRRALEATGLLATPHPNQLRMADVGCGTGASTLMLARETFGHVTAVDFLQAFLDQLMVHASAAGLQEHVSTLCADMSSLPFEPGSLDLIWSEGAIYNMGFKEGIQAWKPFLQTGAFLVLSEIAYLTDHPAPELQAYWNEAYPQIGTIADKTQALEDAGYEVVTSFPLPADCWETSYYGPLEAQFDPFLARHSGSELASAIVDNERAEIALYRQHASEISYGMFVARKR